MLVQLIEVYKPEGESIHLSEIYVRKDSVKMVKAEQNQGLVTEALNLGILPDAEFSRVTILDGAISRSITVVGSVQEIKNKVDTRQLLRD